MLRSRLSRPLGPIAALFLLAGCGGGNASVQGEVSYDGTPVDAGAITFAPVAGDAQKVGARIYDGKYVIEPTAGLAPGPYTVTINWEKKTGQRVSTGEGAMRDETREGLPPKYTAGTELKADITGGANTVDFKLEK